MYEIKLSPLQGFELKLMNTKNSVKPEIPINHIRQSISKEREETDHQKEKHYFLTYVRIVRTNGQSTTICGG
jgi:hypothetical protein